jgi:hypothetical protein
MKNILFILSLSLGLNCFSQKLHNASLLKQDFAILTNAVCEVSPNLNLKEKEALYSYLNKRSEKLNGKTMTTIEFFKFLMDTKAKTKLDEHGSLSLSNEVMKELLIDKKVLFPIPIIILNNKLIVNHERVQIPFGSVISEINGMSVSTILDDLVKEKSTFALRNLEQSFDVLYLIKHGVPETYNITYTLPNSSITKTTKLSPIKIKTRENVYSNIVYPLDYEQIKNVINTTYFKNSDSYYIQLNSFNWNKDVKNVYDTFNKQFWNIFKKIKRQDPKNLIIDLRYNSGGNMVIPALFYSYIAQEDFNEYMSMLVPDFKLPNMDNVFAIGNKTVNKESAESFINAFKKPFVKNNDFYEHVFINNIKRLENKKSFKGTVYLLVGGRTFSAATYYTAIFKNYKRGQIVGEQIGGSHHNITAGKQIVYVLPNTKIRLSIPISILKFSQNLATNVPEQKIIPDIQKTEELKYQSFLKKEDWDLQAVFDIITKKKQQ